MHTPYPPQIDGKTHQATVKNALILNATELNFSYFLLTSQCVSYRPELYSLETEYEQTTVSILGP